MSRNGDASNTHPQPDPSGDPGSFLVGVTNEEQISGGRHAPSLPPVLTPTRFRTSIKVTPHDSGLVRQAQARRGRLLNEVPTSSPIEEDPFIAPPPSRTVDKEPAAVQCASLLFPSDGPGDPLSFFLPKEDGNGMVFILAH